MRDYRDLAIEHLADDVGALEGRVGELEAEVELRRVMVSVLLERCHILTQTVEGLRRVLKIEDRDERAAA